MFNLLVRVRCTSFPEIRVMCLLTLAFLFCVKYPSRLCSFESKTFWNLHFFLRTHYRQMAWGSMLTWTGGAVQILLTCFPSSLFSYPCFTHSCPRSSFWSFSATRRLVTTSQRLLFRWKYRRRSSFLVSTPQNKSKDANSPKGHLYYIVGRKFLFE